MMGDSDRPRDCHSWWGLQRQGSAAFTSASGREAVAQQSSGISTRTIVVLCVWWWSKTLSRTIQSFESSKQIKPEVSVTKQRGPPPHDIP